jgi:hypothetical protein
MKNGEENSNNDLLNIFSNYYSQKHNEENEEYKSFQSTNTPNKTGYFGN